MNTAIFWPMIIQVALVYGIYLLMSARRMGAVKAGTAKADDYRIPNIEPEPGATVARSLISQFELPVLFFVVCLSLYVTNGAGYLAVFIAWLFVLSRIAHALVHVTSNRLRYRRPLFATGFLLNLFLWLILAVHLL